MQAIVELFQEAGCFGWLVVLAGLFGLAVGALGLVVAHRADGGGLVLGGGLAGVASGVLVLLVGFLGMIYGEHQVARAVAHVEPALREELLHAGHREARAPLAIAFALSLVPLFLGALGCDRAVRKRQASAGLAYAGLVVALVAPVVAGVVHTRPLPGRALTRDEWAVVRLHDAVAAGPAGCERLERDLPPPGSPARAMPELAEAVRRCVDHRLAQADAAAIEGVRPPRAGLEALLRLDVLEPEQRARLDARLAALDAEEKLPAEAPPPAGFGSLGGPGRRGPSVPAVAAPTDGAEVRGALPPDAVRRVVQQHAGSLRRCYERALARKPSLGGRLHVRFVIGTNGEVSRAEAVVDELDDPSVTACVLRAFRGLAFPRPERGLVTVTYPLTFRPG